MYVPVSADPIDKNLSKYINSSSDPLKLSQLFVRERKGIYNFGSKKVFLKVESGKMFGK